MSLAQCFSVYGAGPQSIPSGGKVTDFYVKCHSQGRFSGILQQRLPQTMLYYISSFLVIKWISQGFFKIKKPMFLELVRGTGLCYVNNHVLQDFPGGSDGKESACNAGDPGSIPGWGRFPGEGNGYPLQYSCLKNPMDKETWQATVHGVAKSQPRLSN